MNNACSSFFDYYFLLAAVTVSPTKIHLPSGHSLSNESFEGKLLLLEILRSGIFDLELSHSIAESGFDLLLVTTLQLHRHGGIGDDLLDAGNVRLQLLAGLTLLCESLVARFELGGI